MIKRVSLFMGLCILSVVVSHAAGWGQIAMFDWTDRYRPVTVPNFDQLGTLPYYVLLVIRQLTAFAVAGFLFASGFFMAYAARGNRATVSWTIVKARIVALLVPYAIWSLVCLAGDALEGIVYSPAEYLMRLVTGTADGGSYYFVPLLCQFYLLSPFIVRLAKTRWRLLLLAATLIQLSAFGVNYLHLSLLEARVPVIAWRLTWHWLFFLWAAYFPLGVVCGFHVESLKRQLVRFRWGLLALVFILGVLSIVEAESIYRTFKLDWRFMPVTITTALYSVAFTFCFLAFPKAALSSSRVLYKLDAKSYGIYLLHLQVMEFVARVIRLTFPHLLAHELVFSFIIFLFGLGVPLLFMTAVARSPTRRYYRYLFA
jgi:peptidoglycan/LPS O-acetylase OafA/YrhL